MNLIFRLFKNGEKNSFLLFIIFIRYLLQAILKLFSADYSPRFKIIADILSDKYWAQLIKLSYS